MSPRQSDSQSRRTLVIGLVNNASGGALQSTERRFARLLHNADPHIDVRLRLFRFLELPNARGEQGDVAEQYADLCELFQTPLDALIVTGMEPHRPALEDEPIWASITKLARWAEDQAIPTIWSCLAAHAAVLHLDGIARSQLPEKLSGVFRCDVTATDHPLMQGIPCQLASPHSRFYGLRGEQLLGAGYQILSRSDEAGVDIFFKRRAAPFVFFQGHPEYDSDTLLREYRRDVRRYLAGTQAEQPVLPAHYFDRETEAALSALGQRLFKDRSVESSNSLFSALSVASLAGGWLCSATQLCANWLACVASRNAEPRDAGLFARRMSVRCPQPELANAEAAMLQ